MASTIITSVLTGTTNSYATAAYQFNSVASDFVTQGVVGTITNTSGVAPSTGAFAVNAQGTPAMFVDVTAGRAYITATPSGQTSQSLSIYMSATYTSYAISSNASGSTKYDWIYLKVDPTKANAPDSAGDDATALYTSRSSSNSTDNGTPPTYGILLAIVTVANGASSITNSNIVDGRSVAALSATSQGWTPVSDSWTYASYSAPTGTITVPSDATTKYSAGMRVKFSNNSAVQYGIITKVAATTLTVYFGTDYSLTNSAISSIYYSDRKAPFGFPLDPTKWTVTYSDSSTAFPTNNGSYQQQGSMQITVPIGSFKLLHMGTAQALKASSTDIGYDFALSTSTSSVSDEELHSHIETLGASGTVGQLSGFYREKIVSPTSATIYYVITKGNTGVTGGIATSVSTYYAKAVCAYL